MRQRLKDTFGEAAAFQVIGEPTSAPDAPRRSEFIRQRGPGQANESAPTVIRESLKARRAAFTIGRFRLPRGFR